MSMSQTTGLRDPKMVNLNVPHSIAFDSKDNMYITDEEKNRYRSLPAMVPFLQSGVIRALEMARFDCPEGIDVDSSGYVYVAIPGNSRVQKFTSNGNFVTKWVTEGTANGEFSSHAHGVAIDKSNNVYVTDRFNNRIQKFTSNGNYITQWGSNGTGNGQFDEPHSSAIDSQNNLYVSDMNNHRVQKFTSNGNYITQWGSNVYWKWGVYIIWYRRRFFR